MSVLYLSYVFQRQLERKILIIGQKEIKIYLADHDPSFSITNLDEGPYRSLSGCGSGFSRGRSSEPAESAKQAMSGSGPGCGQTALPGSG